MRYLISGFVLLVFSLGNLAAATTLFDTPSADTSPATVFEVTLHGPWDSMLKRYVVSVSSEANQQHQATRVDYQRWHANPKALTRYLQALAQVERVQYQQWSVRQQLAFLINAYNAHTVAVILKHYPKLDSIKDIGGLFSSAWDQPVGQLLGQARTLDDIEHGMIRGDSSTFDGFAEPRIHFAVNCASIGCPALRREAYISTKLDAQLNSQTRQFLADRSRNRVTPDALYLSKLFDWYEDDFLAPATGSDSARPRHTLTPFLTTYADALQFDTAAQQALANGELAIRYTRYDWALNDLHE